MQDRTAIARFRRSWQVGRIHERILPEHEVRNRPELRGCLAFAWRTEASPVGVLRRH
ncbi:MAG: hypothetical protein WBV74_04330 [Pseudonocardiaceae bacterium]